MRYRPRQLFFFILFLSLGSWCASKSYALNDSDGDLLPDEWETTYFGSATSANPFEDPDGDRLSNLDEMFAATSPLTFNSVGSLTENQLLRLLQGKAFLYFWEQSEAPFYFTHDNANYNGGGSSQNFNSNAATGFSFMAYVIADEMDWVPHSQAYGRIRTALARLVELQSPANNNVCTPLNQQGNRHGYIYHFIDNNGYRAYNNVEISTIDHALLTAGALVAASYYRGTEVEQLATQLFRNTQWNWLFNSNENFFYQGWQENCASGGTLEGGDVLDLWNRYSELMILLFQAMSVDPALGGVSAAAWEVQARGSPVMFPYEWADITPGNSPQNFAFLPNMPNVSEAPGYTNDAARFHFIHAGSIHNHQYSQMFADFRKRRDGFRATDFFANSIDATLANREFCIRLNAHAFGGDPNSPDPFLIQPYETYGPNSWGLLAGITSDGLYRVMQPIIMPWDNFSATNIAANNDSGTVFLWGPVGSTSFTPRESIDFIRNIMVRYQNQEPGYDALVGRYGFMNSFNLGRGFYRTNPPGHFSSAAIGIDIGAAIGGMENYLTGLIWKHSLRRPEIADGMGYRGAGFNTGAVEPFILNFDDNPPLPQEDPNGGGQDPNSFGGNMYSFGSGTINYAWIDDPRPDIPFGPQDFAAEISAGGNQDSGGFILLNNHSVSNWERLSFWIRGESVDENFAVGLKDSVVDYKGSPLEATEIKLPVKDFIPGGQIPTDWTEVRIPLGEFSRRGVRLTRLDNISFSNLKSAPGRIWVDDIAFLGDEFAPSAPRNVRIAVSGNNDVLVTWDENPEPDVAGYHVYRRRPDELNFTQLTNTLIVDRSYLDPAAATQVYEYAVTAVDNALPPNESSFSDVFYWTVRHDVPYHATESYTSAAAVKIILDYLRPQDPVSETDIYNYGIQQNSAENQVFGNELDPRGADAALGHFDPYDASLSSPYNSYDTRPDGNPYQGYNFSIVTKSAQNLAEYVRDICHWMDYPAPLYYGSTQRTMPDKVPPVVPIFGTYDRWVVVNGFAASADPLPDENNPWNTPNFIVYGFWLTDPDENGIGVNRFVSAEEAAATYFMPVTVNDTYVGKLVMVAEPPQVRSKAKTFISKSPQTASTLEAAAILSRTVNGQNSTAGTASATSTALSANSAGLINWPTVIPRALFDDAGFADAFSNTLMSGTYRVERIDKGTSYLLVSFDKRDIVASVKKTSVAIIIDAKTGVFKEATWLKEPDRFSVLNKTEAVQKVLDYIGRTRLYSSRLSLKVSAKLFWEPRHSLSSSPFHPLWQIIVNGCVYEVSQSGEVKAVSACVQPAPKIVSVY